MIASRSELKGKELNKFQPDNVIVRSRLWTKALPHTDHGPRLILIATAPPLPSPCPAVTDHFPSLLDHVAGLQQVFGRHRYVLGEVVVVVGHRAGRMVVRALTRVLARLDPAEDRSTDVSTGIHYSGQLDV